MKNSSANKRKIINDPVLGFINIPSDTIFDLVESPYFQRLRRIKQLGLTNFVYPGATHTRFQHALGAMFLMSSAINIIRSKGHHISDKEAEAVTIAILLHDIGHGPFSHALEHSILNNITHEDLSAILMNKLNKEYKGKLDLAIKIFNNLYQKKFLHQLVSSQLDMDRLDYLKRDCFFTGVTEGAIGSDRIIKMLEVHNDQLVIEAKGIYSIENFLIARRLMYWQVYLHKTVISAEQLLVKILKRAKELSMKEIPLFATPSLSFFLNNIVNKNDLINDPNNINTNIILDHFNKLDDNDIMGSIKVWSEHEDKVLSLLCKNLINRNLYKIEVQNQAFNNRRISDYKDQVKQLYNLNQNDVEYFVFSDFIINNAYKPYDEKIRILHHSGELTDIADSSDMLNLSLLSKEVKKYFLCYPKECKPN